MGVLETVGRLVELGGAPEQGARVAELRASFEGRTGAFSPDDPWFEERARAFWTDAVTAGRLGRATEDSLGDDDRRWLGPLERAHRGLFRAEDDVLVDVWSGAELALTLVDEATRAELDASAGQLLDGRVVGALEPYTVALLPGVVFHPPDATPLIEPVLAAARGRAMTRDETLDALLRMHRALRSLSRVKASYAYRPEALAAPASAPGRERSWSAGARPSRGGESGAIPSRSLTPCSTPPFLPVVPPPIETCDRGRRRVLLIDPTDARREVLARRLRAQGYEVDETREAAEGAEMALREPPSAVVADLWMPGISGVQLCRLLRSEPATADVPVILCSDEDEPRNRFWSERAGASYVMKGRIGDLVRTLAREVGNRAPPDGFFVQLSGGSVDIRDRLARHLDAALFESVIAAEVRALASAGSFERLFDSLAQFMSAVTRYRWMAVAALGRVAIHHHPTAREQADREVRAALELEPAATLTRLEDEDAASECAGPEAIVHTVRFADHPVARFALAPRSAPGDTTASLVPLVVRELGGAIRIAALVEQTEHLAATDALTGLTNRRAFEAGLAREASRAARYDQPLSLVLLDVDHFKRINDVHGHAVGDRVLAALGGALSRHLRQSDLVGRWGGEEFTIAYSATGPAGAAVAAERVRRAIEELVVLDEIGMRVRVTASLGVASWRPGLSVEALVDAADRAMYEAKAAGRNRVVCLAGSEAPPSCPGGSSEPARPAPSIVVDQLAADACAALDA